ncbi:MAG TPA: ribonuclease H [Caulobacteraceae bacterium]|jgi:hypothetical protein
MTSQVQIWTCAAHHSVFRCGGWASVRLSAGLVTGVAGGERNTTARRMALAGLVAALRDLPSADSSSSAGLVRVHTTSPELAAFAGFLADSAAGASPDEDLDLWAQIVTAAKGRRLDLVRAPVHPGSPMAFAAAWADLGMDKAKARGPFTAAIPKPNLAQVRGLG